MNKNERAFFKLLVIVLIVLIFAFGYEIYSYVDKDINTNVDISTVPNSQGNQIISIIPVSQNDIIYIYTYSETNNTIAGGGNPAVWVSCEIMSL